MEILVYLEALWTNKECPPHCLPSLSSMTRELGTMGKAILSPKTPLPLVDAQLPALPSPSPRWRGLGTMGMATP